MWAIRRASIPIRLQTFSTAAFRACRAKHDVSGSCYTDKTGFTEPPSQTPDGSLLLKRFSSVARSTRKLSRHAYSSAAGAKSSGEDDDLEDGFSELETSGADVTQGNDMEDESDDELATVHEISEEDDSDIAGEEGVTEPETESGKTTHQPRRVSSELFKVVMDSSTLSVSKTLDKWLEEGNTVSRSDVSVAMTNFRNRRMFSKALQLSEWLESRKQVEFGEKDYASRIDLIAKLRGLQPAEGYIEKIPESFRGELVYRTLLANCVRSTNVARAEKIFNKMKLLKFPVTAFACNQLLLLYKRTDKKKIADVLLLMEKENVKPSVFTYSVLIDVKGQSNDISGMEQIVETMKGEGIEPDTKVQALVAKYYVYAGLKDKATAVLNEMEGGDLEKHRWVCSYLLPLYASLGSADDVERVWKACEPNPRFDESMAAIDAWGRLKRVERAEAVFDQMSKKWKRPLPKFYTAMLKVYAANKLFEKGKSLVKQMAESGCRIGPMAWDSLVRLYVDAGELEKADSILLKAAHMNQIKPLFNTYLLVLDQYAKRGDVHNAEKVFHRMRQDGYVSRLGQYHRLLQAYVNAKAPVYGFKERMKADNVFPNRALADQLAQADPFKKTAVSDLLD